MVEVRGRGPSGWMGYAEGVRTLRRAVDFRCWLAPSSNFVVAAVAETPPYRPLSFRSGSGSGYLVAVLSHLVGPAPALVFGIDHIPALVSTSLAALRKSPYTSAALVSSSPSIKLHVGDGRAGAPPAELPGGGWDAIHVGAAAPAMPERLVEQLKAPGRMFIPVGIASQAIWQVDKDEQGKVTKTKLFGVNYVP